MIVYCYIMGESVAALCLAGIVPGALIGLSLVEVIRMMANTYDLPPATHRLSSKKCLLPYAHVTDLTCLMSADCVADS